MSDLVPNISRKFNPKKFAAATIGALLAAGFAALYLKACWRVIEFCWNLI